MTAANRHPLRAVFLGALQLLLSLGTAANLVFCSAASGHVAVESAFDADCCDRPPWVDTFGLVHAEDGCGCVDTPLLQSPVEPRSKSSLTQAVALAAFAPTGVIPGLEPPRCRHAPGAEPTRVPPELNARRSVVLVV